MVFSLSPEKEAERKPLFGKNRKNLASDFFKILTKDTVEMASKCGVQVFYIDEKQQKGNDFTSRYTNAFSEIFKLGFKNVISVGNDSPGLTIQHLNTAIAQIASNGSVIGPSEDGGVYLLGMNRSCFNADTFSKLPWQKSELYAKLITEFQNQNASIFCLDFLVDIDTTNDLLTFAEENPNSFLSYYILNSFFQNSFQFYIYILKNYSQKAQIFLPLRAPPFFSLAA